MKKIICAVFCVGLGVFLVGQAAGQSTGPTVTQEEVAGAVEKAVSFIKSRQLADGSWPYAKPEHVQGATALAVLALSQAGVDENDPAIAKGLAYVLSKPLSEVYNASCAAMAFESVNPARYIKGIAQARDFLVKAQKANGMWSYKLGDALRTSGDNSNTQFAILGLHAAMSVGLDVPEVVLQRAQIHYTKTQADDGGWAYRAGGKSYGSMTAAGVASLWILGARLYEVNDLCGQYRQDRCLAAGLAWLADNYTTATNPSGPAKWLYYYLYALERVGVLTGQKYIGGHDWYLDGARRIVDTQNPDGSWTSGRDQIPNTCFALLFLSKGNVPVLVNKLVHGGGWNVDPHDAANLTAYISKRFGQRVGWQSVTLDDSMETLLSAPVLYVTGIKSPDFKPDEIAKLREFFERGGFMLADACCSKREFDTNFRAFVSKVFPERHLQRLGKSTHPVYRSWFNLTNSTRSLEGIQAGCRTPLVYSAKDFSCFWEKNNVRTEEEAFQFGLNIAAYATGKERLKPKLEQAARTAERRVVAAPPGAFTFAQVVYAGRWDPHPAASERLLAFLGEKAGLTVASKPVTLPLTDENLANYPFIYLTGIGRFALGDEEKKALRRYLEKGGFLFADAACGKAEFDESFRALVGDVLGSSRLEPIGPDSPIYRMAFNTRKVRYTAAVRESDPGLDTLTLYGAKVKGRVAVVYSPWDIGCALEGFPSYGSRGLVSEDAFKVAANVVLFALTY